MSQKLSLTQSPQTVPRALTPHSSDCPRGPVACLDCNESAESFATSQLIPAEQNDARRPLRARRALPSGLSNIPLDLFRCLNSISLFQLHDVCGPTSLANMRDRAIGPWPWIFARPFNCTVDPLATPPLFVASERFLRGGRRWEHRERTCRGQPRFQWSADQIRSSSCRRVPF